METVRGVLILALSIGLVAVMDLGREYKSLATGIDMLLGMVSSDFVFTMLLKNGPFKKRD